jgi:hypothetical protein
MQARPRPVNLGRGLLPTEARVITLLIVNCAQKLLLPRLHI